MKRFLIKGGLLVALNVAIGLAVILAVDSSRHYEQWETDSVLYATPKSTAFDFVSLGTSRARIFSEFKDNHDLIRNEFHQQYLNLAIPFGGGILPERLFLEYFFDRGNTTRAVVLLLDPFMMFSDGANRLHRFVFYEPFRVRFLIKLVRSGIPIQQIITYARSKFGRYWLERKPVVKQSDPRVVERTDSDAELARKRMDSLYPEGVDDSVFRRYTKDLTAIIEMAQRHHARMLILFAPTLLGPEPGAGRVSAFLDECRDRYAFEFHDFTNVFQDDALFADHDHLNSRGFERFMREYLEPILSANHG